MHLIKKKTKTISYVFHVFLITEVIYKVDKFKTENINMILVICCVLIGIVFKLEHKVNTLKS